MAELLETKPEDETLDQLPTDETAMSPEQVIEAFSDGGQTAEPPFSNEPEELLPEKYQGKSLADVVEMHQEAEKALGRQGSEVGELRKVVDTYIQSQMQQQTPQVPEEPAPDYFEDPEKAVSHAIAHHPEVKAAREAATTMQRQTALSQLQQKHPDMQTVLQDPKFVEWVQGSPIRSELFARADKEYDFQAADELFSTYKERSQVTQQAVQVETEARKQQLRAASTGTATGANTTGAKRVYRRSDIIKLMKEDPDRYEALSPEIMQAYAEGRVK